MEKDKRSDRISISLSPEEKKALEQIALKNQISIARVVRQAIANFLHSPDRQLFLFNSHSMSEDVAD